MKRLVLVLVCLGMAAVARADEALLVSTTTMDTIADWATIQAAGGIDAETPVPQQQSTWKVPLLCDMATNAPGTVISNTLVDRAGDDVLVSLTLHHTAWTMTPERSKCRPIMVQSSIGKHGIFYRDASGKTTLIKLLNFQPLTTN